MVIKLSRCYIVGAGDCEKLNIKPKEGDLVMAADGGYKYLKRSKINCDIIIGDFDSMEKPDFKNVITLPKEKDVSDMEECMRYALL